jgi:hypothetical protein
VKPILIPSLLLLLFSSVDSVNAQERIDFSRDIRPILSENCYFCHGPDAKERKADLRLDVEKDARDWFEPGEPEESDLFLRISTRDKSELMPPADSHRKLTPKQIGLVRRWIEEGGQWGQHWSFAPIKNKAIATPNPYDAIDVFIQRKLIENEIDFSVQASKRTLVRRVSIDLTGLPPNPQQLEEYLTDESEDAYSKMVDRFLDSPAYGERMAWTWLDAARYADSNGYQGDGERTMWPWRDWVVKAFNDNMPFDKFSKWQLAGDLIPNATEEQILATGFNRNHPINGEGGRIAEENRIDYVMDMAETTGTVWLGLTFNCCRCHDHKYDQLSQKDYYSLFAFFDQTPVDGSGGNSQTPPIVSAPSNEQNQRLVKLESEIARLNKALRDHANELTAKQAAWEDQILASEGSDRDWHPVDVRGQTADHANLELQADRSILSTGESADRDVYRVTASTNLQEIRGVCLETLRHRSMTGGGLTKSESSNFVLTEFQLFVVDVGGKQTEVQFDKAIADFEQIGHSIDFALDESTESGWAVWKSEQTMRRERTAVFQLNEALKIPEGSTLNFVLKHESVFSQHNIGRFRLSVTQGESELPATSLSLHSYLRTPLAERTQEQLAEIKKAYLGSDPDYRAVRERLANEQKVRDEFVSAFPKVMVMADMPKPRKSFLLNRGSYQKPGEEVFANVPAMLQPLKKGEKADRLALANWLFDDSNPLTARVAVNRIWAGIFGIGLVKTTEDFGVQGEPPSHPELLDWLAAEYRDSGWDTKHMLRLILNSRTYRQSSKTDLKRLQLDPRNRLLGRATRYRMPGWMIRDYALAASGRLVDKVGGPPVHSYQPAGVWEEASFGNKEYTQGAGDELYRRSLYTFWRRIAAPTMFFDNADRMVCSVKAFRTNTPLHALTTLNDVTFVESARLLATRAMKTSEDDGMRLAYVFQRLLARLPSDKESQVLLAALNRTKRQYLEDQQAAKDFAAVGATPLPENLNVVELASWTNLCLAVLNLDETLTRQ